MIFGSGTIVAVMDEQISYFELLFSMSFLEKQAIRIAQEPNLRSFFRSHYYYLFFFIGCNWSATSATQTHQDLTPVFLTFLFQLLGWSSQSGCIVVIDTLLSRAWTWTRSLNIFVRGNAFTVWQLSTVAKF